jgi:hypothetical protein
VASFLTLPILAILVAAEPTEKDPRSSPEYQALARLMAPIADGDDKAAQQAYEKLVKEFSGKPVADEATWKYACFHYQRGRLDQAQELLLSLRRSGRDNASVSMALIALADVAQERGDERAMIGYLEEAQKTKATPTGRNLMDTLDTRQEAMIRLARHYQSRGEFKKAYECWVLWEPKSWSATTAYQLRWMRWRQMAQCQLQAGDNLGFVRERWRELQNDEGPGPYYSWLLWCLYDDAGQLADLRAIVEAHEKSRKKYSPDEKRALLDALEKKMRMSEDIEVRRRAEKEYDALRSPPPTQDLQDILRVQDLLEKKDVAALIALCQKYSPPGAKVLEDGIRCLNGSVGAEALARMGGAEVEAIKSALARNPEAAAWLIYALGRSGDSKATDVLKKLAKEEGDNNYSTAQNIAYALALRDPYELRQFAEGKELMAKAAREWIGRRAEPICPKPNWPAPKAGSLPKTLAEVR